jgi:hypothetical protein
MRIASGRAIRFSSCWLVSIVLGYGLGSVASWRVNTSAPTAPHVARELPGVQFNQQFVEGLGRGLEVTDPEEVFAYVFDELSGRVSVRPTENYYYFTFTANGAYFWGNLRLAPEDRDQGWLHFAYFEHGRDEHWYYRPFKPGSGVAVTRLGALRYSVEYRGKQVIFELNDLPQRPPPFFRLLPGEEFLGRCFDESGFQLLLLYNRERKYFMFALDREQDVPWSFESLGKHLRLHPSSGFVFFEDADVGRELLVGVDVRNVELNNYFDGPFDQLPDNFIAATRFADYVQAAYPYTRGQIDSHGRFIGPEGRGRMAITPYKDYDSLSELGADIDRCVAAARTKDALYYCICLDRKLGVPGEGGYELDSPTGRVYGRVKLRGNIVNQP